MKTFISAFITILMLCIIATGCKKDSKKEEIKTNYLKVDGTEYDISQGFLKTISDNSSPDSAAWRIELFLLSSDISYREYETPFSGIGHIIFFNLYSSTNNKIAIGDYDYNNSKNVGSFDSAVYRLNWDIIKQPGNQGIQMSYGTVKVIKSESASPYELSNSGKEYELSFSGTDANNKAISGYYKGRLLMYFYHGYKKSPKFMPY